MLNCPHRKSEDNRREEPGRREEKREVKYVFKKKGSEADGDVHESTVSQRWTREEVENREEKQAPVPILKLLFTLFYAHVFCFPKNRQNSSIKVQLCFFVLLLLLLHASSCRSAPPPSSHSALILLFPLKPFLSDPSQRLLFAFASSSAVIVCVSSHCSWLCAFVRMWLDHMHVCVWDPIMMSWIRNGFS